MLFLGDKLYADYYAVSSSGLPDISAEVEKGTNSAVTIQIERYGFVYYFYYHFLFLLSSLLFF